MASQYDLLFEQWKAQLANRDRSIASVQTNFEELFDTLRSEGLVLESAYEYLPRAVKAHAPPAGVVKRLFKKFKVEGKTHFTTEKEFEDQWIKGIEEKANAAFFNIFPVQTKKSEEKNEPKIFGGMTEKEYRMQRKFADEFPVFSTKELEKKLAEPFDPTQELDALLGRTGGNSK